MIRTEPVPVSLEFLRCDVVWMLCRYMLLWALTERTYLAVRDIFSPTYLCVCVWDEEGIRAKKEDIMILHSPLDPANCYRLTKDDLSARGVIYILHASHFVPSFSFSLTLFSTTSCRKGHWWSLIEAAFTDSNLPKLYSVKACCFIAELFRKRVILSGRLKLQL